MGSGGYLLWGLESLRYVRLTLECGWLMWRQGRFGVPARSVQIERREGVIFVSSDYRVRRNIPDWIEGS